MLHGRRGRVSRIAEHGGRASASDVRPGRFRSRPPVVAAALLALGAAALSAQNPSDCPSLPGGDSEAVDRLLTGDRVIVLGELHGTAQAPALVVALACRAARRGGPVIVGLELPAEEQERIQTFLAASGDDGSDAAPRAALLAGEIWRRAAQDGRTSTAMVELLEDLREIGGAGADLEVVLFDRMPASGSRDRAMAERLAELLPEPHRGIALVLTGNLHARVSVGTRWDPAFEPMARSLAQLRPGLDLVALDLGHSGGRAWICQPAPTGCGAVELRGRDEAPGLHWGEGASESDAAYHGRFQLGPITASPPAIGVGNGEGRDSELEGGAR